MSLKNDINVVPLIDIVLVLLIVFIVMVPGMQKSLPAVIPQIRKDVEPPKPDPSNPPLVLDVTPLNYSDPSEGYALAVNQSPLNLSDIPERLFNAIKLQPHVDGQNLRKVFLNVDRDVSWDWVVQVMDQLRLTSERVKLDTIDSGLYATLNDGRPYDGGDTKIIIKLKKRPGE
jgi:biopolymer transport protein ExbD